MTDERPLSDRLVALSGELGHMVSSEVHAGLRDMALEARRLERFADEIVSEAQEDERISRGLHPLGEDVTTIVARARRLSSTEGSLR